MDEYRGECSCAQSILATYGQQYGLDRETALRLAAAFGTGMGGRGQCGAVTGAMMVLGLHFGRPTEDDQNGEIRAHEAADFFIEQFTARNGSIGCSDLLGYNPETGEGMMEIMEQNLITTRCPKFVHDAAEILELMLHTGSMN